jgi:hypothetical protein
MMKGRHGLLRQIAALSVCTFTGAVCADSDSASVQTDDLGPLAGLRQVRLSADSTRFVFVDKRDGDDDIFVADVDHPTPRLLTSNEWDDAYPTWTSDDSSIVFVGRASTAPDLYVIGIDGRGERALNSGESFTYDPAWPLGHLTTNTAPSAWLSASSQGGHTVRLRLAKVFDREDGRSLNVALDFGDGADTSFSKVPTYIDHAYGSDGTYGLALHVRDSGGLKRACSLI